VFYGLVSQEADYEVFRARVGVADPDYVNQFRYSA